MRLERWILLIWTATLLCFLLSLALNELGFVAAVQILFVGILGGLIVCTACVFWFVWREL